MITASLCTIPDRRAAFLQVLDSLLNCQTRPLDRLHIWLNGFTEIPTGLPTDQRLVAHLEPGNPGPWIRYQAAGDLQPGDCFITLDDDLMYPPDYVEQGIRALQSGNPVVCFSGICWDPLAWRWEYGLDRWQYEAEDALDRHQVVALLKGQTSFFSAAAAHGLINDSLPGFRSNDDMMVSYCLQERGIPILCCPHPARWIHELPESRAPHALYRQDSSTRHATFSRLVNQLGFDPTAGRLDHFRQKPQRVIYHTAALLTEARLDNLHLRLLAAVDDQSGLHLIVPAGSTLIGKIQRETNRPYIIHAVNVLEPGGRLDWFSPVRAWREKRVNSDLNIKISRTLQRAVALLQPEKVISLDKNHA